jgi:hypothetical protein
MRASSITLKTFFLLALFAGICMSQQNWDSKDFEEERSYDEMESDMEPINENSSQSPRHSGPRPSGPKPSGPRPSGGMRSSEHPRDNSNNTDFPSFNNETNCTSKNRSESEEGIFNGEFSPENSPRHSGPRPSRPRHSGPRPRHNSNNTDFPNNTTNCSSENRSESVGPNELNIFDEENSHQKIRDLRSENSFSDRGDRRNNTRKSKNQPLVEEYLHDEDNSDDDTENESNENSSTKRGQGFSGSSNAFTNNTSRGRRQNSSYHLHFLPIITIIALCLIAFFAIRFSIRKIRVHRARRLAAALANAQAHELGCQCKCSGATTLPNLTQVASTTQNAVVDINNNNFANLSSNHQINYPSFDNAGLKAGLLKN